MSVDEGKHTWKTRGALHERPSSAGKGAVLRGGESSGDGAHTGDGLPRDRRSHRTGTGSGAREQASRPAGPGDPGMRPRPGGDGPPRGAGR